MGCEGVGVCGGVCVCVCVHVFRRECVWVRFEGCGSEDVGVRVYMWEGR